MHRSGSERSPFARWTVGIAFLVAIILATTDAGTTLEEGGRNLRDALRSQPASGRVAVVEIDAASLKRYSHWPWPRGLYARLLDRLNTARVESVAFDIDFSAPSDARNDTALAQALARFEGTAILATFKQSAGAGRTEMDENLPLPSFARSAFLASVNVHPDADGIMRDYSYGTRTGNVARPSLGALIADARGAVDVAFRIDQSIEPGTIPRFSFADIVDGRVDPRRLAGKRLIVGGTAIELGDRYAVPRHGLLPGVIVQAQAAETLLNGVPPGDLGWWPPVIVVTALSLWWVRKMGMKAQIISCAVTAVGLVSLSLLMELDGLFALQVAPALGQLLALAAMALAFRMGQKLIEQRHTDTRSGLPNSLALAQTVSGNDECLIVAARFPAATEVAAFLPEEGRASLQLKTSQRLGAGAQGRAIHTDGVDIYLWSVHPQTSEPEIDKHLQGLAALFRAPLEISGRAIMLTPAFGLARGKGGKAADLIAKAGRAATQAVTQEQLWLFDHEELASRAESRQRLLAHLPIALERNQLWVAYQPKVDIKGGGIAGAEALLRWDHPDWGEISPADFVPLLEEARHMDAATLYVLDRVIADIDGMTMLPVDFRVAVNISTTLLVDSRFIDALHERLAVRPHIASHLTFEVTESATIGDHDHAAAVLDGLVARGVSISIDDYGTGQSTLSYLRAFPASEIKIDQCFIRNLTHSHSDQVLVRSTIELAHQLNFKVVAEGVETAECLEMLGAFGCDIAQGWQTGRPMRFANLAGLLPVAAAA